MAAILLAVTVPQVRLQVRVHGRHPWFYRKMVKKPDRPLTAGSVVHAYDKTRRLVGTGFYNPRCELALRMFSSAAVEDPDTHFVGALHNALDLREKVLDLPRQTNSYRVVHSDADGFPGLVIDRLADAFVAQVQSLGMSRHLDAVGEQLRRHHRKCHLVLLQDADAAKREGMDRIPPAHPAQVLVQENGIDYVVEAGGGHKTGFFADQRDNRILVRQLARGRHVLDLCCNGGGFAMNAMAGGARSVMACDLDEEMVGQAQENARRNRLKIQVEHHDAFDLLRQTPEGRHDLLILDPPKWIHHKDELEDGVARYRDLNRLALQKAAPGAILVTCSCSGSLSEDSFLRMLREAAAQARRDIRLIALRGAGADHPVALECPETRYLKVAFLQVRS